MTAAYDNFLVETLYPYCWWCGRGMEHQPESWYGPWLIERAHMVSSPRVKDARVIVLLCSMCHRMQHGAQLTLPECKIGFPTVPNMFWLKRRFDAERYDRKYLQQHSIARLPMSSGPLAEVRSTFTERRGSYPPVKTK